MLSSADEEDQRWAEKIRRDIVEERKKLFKHDPRAEKLGSIRTSQMEMEAAQRDLRRFEDGVFGD